MIRRTTRRTAGLLVAFMILAACGDDIDGTDDTPADDPAEEAASDEDDAADDDDGQDEADEQAGDDRSDWPDPVVYAQLATDDEAELLSRYEPFTEYMEECLDHPFELFTGTNYAATVEAMRTGSAHLARHGSFSYIIAHERAGADALVQGVAAPDEGTYQAAIITLESHGFETLADLEGESFGFVDAGSTSGHIFPRSHLVNELGIANDEIEPWFGEVLFTGGHDSTVLSVLNEDVAAGALSSNHWITHVETDEPDERYVDHPNFDELVILDSTPDIPRPLETIQRDLPDSLREAAKQCFLDLAADPRLDEYREAYNYGHGFIEVEDSAFDVIRDTAAALEMSPDDLLE